MLIMFKVKNYMSFKNESILDMRATSFSQHPSHLVTCDDGTRFLKTTAIYGANASGKSNFISAMYFFEQYIFSQFLSKKESSEMEFTDLPISIRLEPFLLSDSENDLSEFEIAFKYNNKIYQYGFECAPKFVKSEWYFIDNQKVFERDDTELTFGTKYSKNLKNYTKYPSDRLFLSVLDYFLDNDSRNLILDDFKAFFLNEYNVFSEIIFESTIKKIAGNVVLTRKLIEDKVYREKIEKYLRLIDVGIKGLKIVTLDQNNVDGTPKKKKTIRTVHDTYNSEGKLVGQRELSLSQESTGTLRFLTYIQNIINMIENGGVFIVDEISARLHPLLTKLIIDIFQSENNECAQLIFTTHDVSLLTNTQFRRDEVVFIDKDIHGESNLYSLSDLKIREDATFNKDYLQGKYGAIPIFNYDEVGN